MQGLHDHPLVVVEVGLDQAPQRGRVGVDRDDSFDAWLARTSALAGPLAKRLALLPDAARRELRDRLEDAVRPYRSPSGLDFPGMSLVAARAAG
ncbi:MAG TPA: hypothetical protein VG846_07665 [Actinomycetota bacterium]|nr:hypothetical protein [Actinomycetota bacterium]